MMSAPESRVEVPVLISGGGPAGLMAAILLTKMNIPCRLIERSLQVSPLSKALVIHARTLEFLFMNGLLDKFLEEGRPMTGFDTYNGGKKGGSMPILSNKESHYGFGLFLEQVQTATILDQKLQELGVHVDRGWELMDTKVIEGVDADGKNTSWVETTIRKAVVGDNTRTTESKVLGVVEEDPDEPGKLYHTQIVKSKYLIASDGGKSVVRHKVDIKFPGRTLDNNIIIYDGHIDCDIPFGNITAVNGDNNRIMGFFPLQDGVTRLIIDNGSLTPEEHAALKQDDLTLEKAQEAASTIIAPLKIKLLDCKWLTYYRVNERQAEHFSYKNRIFLAGDAAHVHSPAGGMGMNTGMQDSVNLTWKMALVLQGLAPESILESYEVERKPVADHVIKLSAKMLEYGMAQDFFRRTLKRIMISLGPYVFPYIMPSSSPVSMISLRYSENDINRRHKTQPVPDEDYEVGQRMHDGDLQVLVKGETGPVVSGASEGQDGHSTLRVQELLIGPGIFHILVFTSDMLTATPLPATIKGIETTHSTELTKHLEKHLMAWRSKWSYHPSHMASAHSTDDTRTAPAAHTAGTTPLPHRVKDLFQIHVITSDVNGATSKGISSVRPETLLALNQFTEKTVGDGRLYLDASGAIHQKYGIAAKSGPGGIIVARPDSHIGFRVQGAGPSAWDDVEDYLNTILTK